MYKFNTIDEAIEDLKNGKMLVVVDDESRENEGDLIMPAETVTPQAINFIATHAKGLICTPASKEILDKLSIGQMVADNTDNHSTAFSVSVDHIETTTGISAYERAFTINKMAEDDAIPQNFRRPGHVFPLEAKKGGVLVRRGHTEATVDLARLAGFKPIGVCCEIMSDDGHMARTPELMDFAKKHDLKIITVDALVDYIYKNFYPIKLVSQAHLPTAYGVFEIKGFVDDVTGEHHIALTMGEFNEETPALVRVHSECLTGDVLGSLKCDCGNQLKMALEKISENGSGALIYMRQEGRGIGLINNIKSYSLQEKGLDTVEANLALGFAEDLRHYNGAAQIIKALGIKKIRLMTNNPDKIQSLENCGIDVVERVPLHTNYAHEADFYMQTKKEKMKHML